MRKALLLIASIVALISTAPAFAIQCVPYAREASGINLKGDAWQWWNAAAGVYDRGRTPQDGAVLVFTRQGSMRHGHVSVITRVISNRLVLVDHANWAPARTAGRGEVTRAVPVLDVSAKNDWSQVRVWFRPSEDFGNRIYRTDGFVYQPVNPRAGGRPGIHQAALTKAAQMFPADKALARAAEPHKAAAAVKTGEPVIAAKTGEPVIATKTAEPIATAAAVPAAATIAKAEPATTAAAETAEGDLHPGADGLIRVAKHTFRPRRSESAAEGMLFN